MRIVFSCGDINGVGPEIILKSIKKIYASCSDSAIIAAPFELIKELALQLKLDIDFIAVNNFESIVSGKNVVNVIDLKKFKHTPGKPTKNSGEISYKSIITSVNLIKSGFADALVTAPISKTSFGLAGIKYPGHTELLAELCNEKNFVMMFLSKRMNGSLLTIHEPLKKVPKLITENALQKHFDVVLKTLRNDLRIEFPSIAMLGLNPHAGESGAIGEEEINVINPFIKKNSNYLHGTFSPDAFFANKMEKKFNLVIGMYHDQLLIPFKLMNFGSGVNYTAGLPIIRTSPDHGTAFDIAYKYVADESSTFQAYKYAKIIARNRKNLSYAG